jgi:hypothetical protein
MTREQVQWSITKPLLTTGFEPGTSGLVVCTRPLDQPAVVSIVGQF